MISELSQICLKPAWVHFATKSDTMHRREDVLSSFYHILIWTLLVIGHVGRVASDGEDCTPLGWPNLECNILYTQSCIDRPRSIYQPSKPGLYPGRPRNLKVDISTKFYPAIPSVRVEWNAPDSAGLTTLKAFEVKLTVMGGTRAGTEICRILNMTAANITHSDVPKMQNVIFAYQFKKVRQSTQHYVTVRSLPEPSTSNAAAKEVYKYINTPQTTKFPPHDENNTAYWSTGISVVFDKNEIRIEFEKPPSEYKFIMFRIMIVQNEKTEIKKKETPDTTVVFKNDLRPGMYQVVVEPIEMYDKRRCLCKLENECDICMMSMTPDINITKSSWSSAKDSTTATSTADTSTTDTKEPAGGLPISEPTKENPATLNIATSTAGNSTTDTKEPSGGLPISEPTKENPEALNIGALIGGIIGATVVILVIVIVAVWYYRSCYPGELRCPLLESKEPSVANTPDVYTPRSPKSPEGKPTLGPRQHIPLETRKKLLLLYFADSEDHQKIAIFFANFLESSCSMEVFLHDYCKTEIYQKGKNSWAVEKMRSVDWIVILNSKGAFEEFKNINNPKQTDSFILTDMFFCAMKMLDQHSEEFAEKIISVCFPYTNTKDLIRQFTPHGSHIKLMEDIESFFLRVHGFEKFYDRNNKIELVIANSREYYLTEDGLKLREQIDKMLSLHQGYPDHVNNLDSGLDSLVTLPPSGNFDNIDLTTVFRNDMDDEGIKNGSDNPDAWSCTSIDSGARAKLEFEIERFYQDCPPEGMYFANGDASMREMLNRESNSVNIQMMDNDLSAC